MHHAEIVADSLEFLIWEVLRSFVLDGRCKERHGHAWVFMLFWSLDFLTSFLLHVSTLHVVKNAA
jgi:hypothetical protein